ncbi:hypothetical protein FACS1894214_1070 [Planctomycetales bacterium]|nr:hypothetical protein FACS1894214_1070 [Planctomycetales bacterium]
MPSALTAPAQPALTPSALPISEPQAQPPLDQKYAVFKPVLPPQDSNNINNRGYTAPTDNIVDNILGKKTVQTIPTLPTSQAATSTVQNSTVKMLPVPENSLAEKDKPLSTQAAKPADKVSEQPLPPQKTLQKTVPNSESNNTAEKPLPLPDKAKQNAATQNTEKKPEPQKETPKEFKAMAPLGIAGVVVSTDTAKRQTRIEIPDTVLFTAGSWQINPEAEKHLRKIAGEIRACCPDAVLDIEGHTDNIDRDPANKTQKHDIASFKSMTIMQYFVKSLVWDSSKITSSSYGAGRPVGDNGTPEGRARNNRIEIVVKS